MSRGAVERKRVPFPFVDSCAYPRWNETFLNSHLKIIVLTKAKIPKTVAFLDLHDLLSFSERSVIAGGRLGRIRGEAPLPLASSSLPLTSSSILAPKPKNGQPGFNLHCPTAVDHVLVSSDDETKRFQPPVSTRVQPAPFDPTMARRPCSISLPAVNVPKSSWLFGSGSRAPRVTVS